MLDWLPPNVSTYGGEIDYFFYVIYYITAVVFFLVAGAMIVFLIKYRYQEGRRATYTHGNTTLEIVWTTATFVAMLVLALVSKPLWGRIKQQVPAAQNSVVVQVTAKQFNWEVRYPGPDGEFDTPADTAAGTLDDYQVDNDMHVPVNAVVRVVLKSKDVIHSFFVPQLRLKQDAVPGHTITAWFKAEKDYTSRFSLGMEFQNDLDNGSLSEDFVLQFSSKSLQQDFKNVEELQKSKTPVLTSAAGVSIQEAGNSWLITDESIRRKYIVKKENGALNVYSNVYEIPCAELCGFGHSGMLGHLYVDTPEDYEQWKNETWPPAPSPSADSLNTQTPPVENQN